MNTKITAKNMIVTQGITNRIMTKTNKMEKYLMPDTDMHVHLSRENEKRRKVEITISFKGTFLRAEAHSDDNLFLAIDSALAKIERQIHKHKTKLSNKLKKEAIEKNDFEFIEEPEAENKLEVVKYKKYPVRPMAFEDAVMQMEMLGHSFFVYVDQDTNNTNVLYLRKDGNLGLLEPEA